MNALCTIRKTQWNWSSKELWAGPRVVDRVATGSRLLRSMQCAKAGVFTGRLVVANIRVREWHKSHHSLTFDSKWPLWWHATDTLFDVQSQITQRLFSTVFWLYCPILKQNWQIPWEDDRIQNGRFWQHATDTPFYVQSQIAQCLFSTIFWLYWQILKQKRQVPWEEFVHKHWKKGHRNNFDGTPRTRPFDVELQWAQRLFSTIFCHLSSVLTNFEAQRTNPLGGVCSNTTAKKTTEYNMANFDGTPRPCPST